VVVEGGGSGGVAIQGCALRRVCRAWKEREITYDFTHDDGLWFVNRRVWVLDRDATVVEQEVESLIFVLTSCGRIC